jgi:hypothetical protein
MLMQEPLDRRRAREFANIGRKPNFTILCETVTRLWVRLTLHLEYSTNPRIRIKIDLGLQLVGKPTRDSSHNTIRQDNLKAAPQTFAL